MSVGVVGGGGGPGQHRFPRRSALRRSPAVPPSAPKQSPARGAFVLQRLWTKTSWKGVAHAMSPRRLPILATAAAIAVTLLLVGCTPAEPPTAAPAAKAAAPADVAKPAAAPATPAGTAASPAPLPPVAVLAIVPVAANANDPNVIKATLTTLPTPGPIYMGATGLTNVSVGVPVALSGSAADPKAPASGYTWTLTVPSTSKATLAKADSAATTFTPDVPGIYKVDLVVKNGAGVSPMASVQIHAGTYVGAEKGGCASCPICGRWEWPSAAQRRSSCSTVIARPTRSVFGTLPNSASYAVGCALSHSRGGGTRPQTDRARRARDRDGTARAGPGDADGRVAGI